LGCIVVQSSNLVIGSLNVRAAELMMIAHMRAEEAEGVARAIAQPHRAGTRSVCDCLDEDRISHKYTGQRA
jgi:hypothetical protein